MRGQVEAHKSKRAAQVDEKICGIMVLRAGQREQLTCGTHKYND